MIPALFVLRKIPEECVSGLIGGQFTQRGGAVYDAAGGIIKHPQFAGDSGLQAGVESLSTGPLASVSTAVGQLKALGMASLALGGLNFAVSIAGFAIVCKKLNQISSRLGQMSDKLDQLLVGQARMDWKQELELHARTVAAVDSLSLGLRTGRHTLVETAIPRLTESSVVYQRVAGVLLENVSHVYCDPIPFQQSMQQAIGCDMAKAQALAHLGHFREAGDVIEATKQLHFSQLAPIGKPLNRGPVWLGLLSDSQAHTARRFVQEQRAIGLAIDYLLAQFQVCQMAGISLEELADLPGGSPFVIISMDDLTKRAS